MSLFGKKIKTWADLLELKHHRERVERGQKKHNAYCFPTRELATITLKEVKHLIKKRQDPNWKDPYGKPLLLHLMNAQYLFDRKHKWNGAQPEIINYLLKNGANPNVSYMDPFHQEEKTLLESVVYANLWAHSEPNAYTKVLLNNGIDLTFKDSGIKAIRQLLCPMIPQENWPERANMILSTGQVDIEKPIFHHGKESVLDTVKGSSLSEKATQYFLYHYYKKQSPEKAERWYGEILAERRIRGELHHHEEQKRQELMEYQKKQSKKTSIDQVKALTITAATLGVISACFQCVGAVQRYNERCRIANSPIGRFKRMLGIRSY